MPGWPSVDPSEVFTSSSGDDGNLGPGHNSLPNNNRDMGGSDPYFTNGNPMVAPKTSSTKQPWQLHKIANATKFDPKNSDGWIREVKYWGELYFHSGDDQMLESL